MPRARRISRRFGGPGSLASKAAFYTDRSPIHGRGLFASRRIRRGEHIGTFEGARTKSDGPHVLWVWRDDGQVEGIRGRNALRYLNHATAPNAEFEGPDLYALRDIAPGHEITIHYGEDWD